MNSKLTSKALVGVVVLSLVTIFAGHAAAQGDFGSQVKLGDADFVPTSEGASATIAVVQVDFGITGTVTDNCFYLDTGATTGSVDNFDIRITPCQGKAAGTMVGDADTVEKGAGSALTVTAVAADVNNNGFYDSGDYLYLTTGGDADLDPSNSLTSVSVRMTPAGGKQAGTLVFASDSDFSSWNAAVDTGILGTVGTAFFDADSTATITQGDNVYIVPDTVADNDLFPQYSVRVAGNAGAFGTQVKLGDADFVPTAEGAGVTLAAVQVDFGITGTVTDNCFYLDTGATTGSVDNFDIRITPCQGKAAGTMVGDADTVEKGAGASITLTAVAADVNNNGFYDGGDFLYLTTGGDADLDPSNSLTSVSIRLTPAGGKQAGTLVFASDSDFSSWNAAVDTGVLGTPEIIFFDADSTSTITQGDHVYVSPADVADGGLFPQYSVRVAGTAGAFGSQVMLGDSDFVPTAEGAGITLAAVQVDFGITGTVTDNCFYLDTGATTGTVDNFDIRLTPCQGKAAGTMVGDADTVEKGAGASITLTAVAADVNNNGFYDSGDYLYLTTGGDADLDPSNSLTSVSIRLTPAGGKQAGTLVFASDSDFSSWNAAVDTGVLGTPELAFFDADSTTTITQGDNVYLAPVDVTDGGLFPQYSVRAAMGSQVTGGPGGGVTPPPTTTPPPTGNETTPPPSGNGTTPPPTGAVDEQAREDAAEARELAQEAKEAAEDASETAMEARTAAEGARDAAEGNQETLDEILRNLEDGGEGQDTPGFGLLMALGALGVVALAFRRRS